MGLESARDGAAIALTNTPAGFVNFDNGEVVDFVAHFWLGVHDDYG